MVYKRKEIVKARFEIPTRLMIQKGIRLDSSGQLLYRTPLIADRNRDFLPTVCAVNFVCLGFLLFRGDCWYLFQVLSICCGLFF